MQRHFFFSLLLLVSSYTLAETPPHSLDTEQAQSIKESYEKGMHLPGASLFTPPEGWLVSDPNTLPPHVHGMVVGPTKNTFPPSLNLGTELFIGTETEYMERVSHLNALQGYETKNLGKIRTQAGNAQLIQVDTKTEWGELRLMQALYLKEGTAYIITAAALKEEFPEYYKEFFQGIRSFRINPTLLDVVGDDTRKKQLLHMREELFRTFAELQQKSEARNPQEAFLTSLFQEEWNRFEEKLEKNYEDLGREWLAQYLKEVENDLLYQEKERFFPS